jgi:hypothetical protein
MMGAVQSQPSTYFVAVLKIPSKKAGWLALFGQDSLLGSGRVMADQLE